MNPIKSDKLLFHYTNIDAAISILQSGVLYFNHHEKMNDPTEFFHADELLCRASEQAFNEMFKKDRKFSVSLKGRKYQQALDHDSKKQIEAFSSQLGNDYYIFSSTQHADKYEMENGSLVMWRGYGKENGCAIVFDKKKLVAMADALPQNGNAASTVNGEICYPEDIEKVKMRFGTEYRFYVDYLKYMASLIFNSGGDPVYNEVIEGLDSYIKMKALIKHRAFKSENEYRLSILRSIPAINGTDIKLMPAENGTVKLPISKNGIPIKKIIISPLYNQDKNYAIMQEFIKSKPEYMNIKITKSEIPHR